VSLSKQSSHRNIQTISTTDLTLLFFSSGIGHALLKSYLSRPNHIVVGSVRDPSTEASKALSQLPKAEGSKLILIKIESSSPTDAAAAVESLTPEHGITKLNLVVANAGISGCFGPVATLNVEDTKKMLNVNAISPVYLFQAVVFLLRKAEKPKFVVITSVASSIGSMEHIPFTLTNYGVSKAAVNYITRRIHFENEWLIAFPISPGYESRGFLSVKPSLP
jgi:norsolorinic acid ketoreductase